MSAWCYCTDSGDGATILCEPHEEIARLRAEVERLKLQTVPLPTEQYTDRITQLERERDEVLARVDHLEGLLEAEITCSQANAKSANEALAQVAVLLDLLEKIAVYVEAAHRIKPDEKVHIAVKKEIQQVRQNVPAEARALLDRLRDAEEIARDVGEEHEKDAVRLEDLWQRLQLAEAVVEAVKRQHDGSPTESLREDILEAPAAWEEDK